MVSYFSFYNYINEVLDIKFKIQDKYDWYQSTSELGLIYPLDNICLVSDRPSEIHINNRLLHNESGMSVKYIDGWGVYSLNGIKMEEWHVMTPADKLKPGDILKVENVDQRRELLNKIGIERMKSYGKVIDKSGSYQLIDMSSIMIEVPYAPYLLMKNPSVENTFHLEGVHPDCKTIEHAINWRAGDINKIWSPISLS